MKGLKEYFNLTSTTISRDENKLCWQFPRLLSMASRKGRVIIFIDGIQKLKMIDDANLNHSTNNGTTHSSNLRWLPTTFPGNVRVIVTLSSQDHHSRFHSQNSTLDIHKYNKHATGEKGKEVDPSTLTSAFITQHDHTASNVEASGTENNSIIIGFSNPRIASEGVRSNRDDKHIVNNQYVFKPGRYKTRRPSTHNSINDAQQGLDKDKHDNRTRNVLSKNKMVVEFTRRNWSITLLHHLSQVQKSYTLLKYICDSNNSPQDSALNSHDSLEQMHRVLASKPLLLFPAQQRDIINHSNTGNPLFLRLLLNSLTAFATQRYNINILLKDFLSSRSYNELLSKVLEYWEEGCEPNSQSVDDAVLYAIANGTYVVFCVYVDDPIAYLSCYITSTFIIIFSLLHMISKCAFAIYFANTTI